MMRKTILFATLIVFGLASCSDDNAGEEIEDSPKEEINKYITGKDLSKSYSLLSNYEVGDGVFNVLGYGYDITGKYAHPAWVKSKVIDVAKLNKESKYSVYIYKQQPSKALGVMSGSRKDVLEDLTYINRRGLLTEEIKKHPNRVFQKMFIQPFENDTSFNSIDYYYSFVFTMDACVFLAFSDNRYLNYLSNEFKNDIILLDGQKIIEKYGTHLLTGIETGRRNDFIYRSSTQKGVQAGIIGRAEDVFGKKLIVGMFLTLKEQYNKENIYYEMVGLKTPETNAWMVDITNSSHIGNVSVGEFEDTNRSEVLVDFHIKKGLLPIYEVIQDEAKKKEVQEAFEKYLSE